MKNVRVRIGAILLISLLVITLGIAGIALTNGAVRSAQAVEPAAVSAEAESGEANGDGLPSADAALPSSAEESATASESSSAMTASAEFVPEEEQAATVAATGVNVSKPIAYVQLGYGTGNTPTYSTTPLTGYNVNMDVDPNRKQYLKFTNVVRTVSDDTNDTNVSSKVAYVLNFNNGTKNGYITSTLSGADNSRTLIVEILPNSPVGTYKITFSLIDKTANGNLWAADGASAGNNADIVYTITVAKGKLDAPTLEAPDTGKPNQKTLTYNGTTQIAALISTYSNNTFDELFTVTLTTNQTGTPTTQKVCQGTRKEFDVPNAGLLRLTVNIKTTAQYEWNSGQNNVYDIIVNRKAMAEDTFKLVYYGGDSTFTNAVDTVNSANGVNLFDYKHQCIGDTYTYYGVVGLQNGMITPGTSTTPNNMCWSWNTSQYDTTQWKLRIAGRGNPNNNSTYGSFRKHGMPITPTSNYCWKDGTTDTRYVYIELEKGRVSIPKITNGQLATATPQKVNVGVTNNDLTTITYTFQGSELEARFADFYNSMITLSVNPTNGSNWNLPNTATGDKTYVWKATNCGTYNLQLTLTNTSWYCWDDPSSSITVKQYYMYINRAEIDDLKILNGILPSSDPDAGKSSGGGKGTTTNAGLVSKYQNAAYYNWLDVEYNDEQQLYLEVEYSPYVTLQAAIYYDGATAKDLTQRDTTASAFRIWWNKPSGNYFCRMELKLDANHKWKNTADLGNRFYYMYIGRKKITEEHPLYFYGTDSARKTASQQDAIVKGNSNGYSVVTMGYTYAIECNRSAQYFSVGGFSSTYMVTCAAVSSTTFISVPTVNTTAKTAEFCIQGAQNPGTYTVSFTPKEGYCWEDGTSVNTRFVNIEVRKTTVVSPKGLANEKEITDAGGTVATVNGVTTVTFTYDKKMHAIDIASFYNPADNVVKATVSGGATATDFNSATHQGHYYFTGTNAVKYTLTLSLVTPAQYKWDDESLVPNAVREYTLDIKRRPINDNGIDHSVKIYAASTYSGTAVELYSGNAIQTVYDIYWPFDQQYVYFEIANARINGENIINTGNKSSSWYNDTGNRGTQGDAYNHYFFNGFNAPYGRGTIDTTSNGCRMTMNRYNYLYTTDNTYIQYFSPTDNYCWSGTGVSTDYDQKIISFRVHRYPLAVPTVTSITGDDKVTGSVTANPDGTYDPTTRTASFAYNGEPRYMYFNNYSAHMNYNSASSGSGLKADTPTGGYSFYATNVGTYTVTFQFYKTTNNSYGYKWYYYCLTDELADNSSRGTSPITNGFMSISYTLKIEPIEIEVPKMFYTGDRAGTANASGVTILNNTVELEYSKDVPHWFFFKNLNSNTMTLKWTYPGTDSQTVTKAFDAAIGGMQGYIVQSNSIVSVGTFKLTVTPNANGKWKGAVTSSEERQAIEYTFNIIPKKVTAPTFANADSGSNGLTKTVTFNKTAQSANLNDWDSGAMTTPTVTGMTFAFDAATNIMQCKATNANTYTITVAFTKDTNYQWKDGAPTGTRTYTYTINRVGIKVPEIEYYGQDSTRSALVKKESTQTIYIDYIYQKTLYFRLSGVNSEQFTASKPIDNNWSGHGFDNTNNRYDYWFRVYNTSYSGTRAEGFDFILTPQADYAWEVNGMLVTDKIEFKILMTKMPIAFPKVSVPTGANYNAATMTLTTVYNDGNQSLAFTDLDSALIGYSVTVFKLEDGAQVTSFNYSNIGSYAAYMTANMTPDDDGKVYFTVKNAYKYVITLTLKDTSLYQWANNQSNPVYTFTVDRAEIDIPSFYLLRYVTGEDGAVSLQPVKDPNDAGYIDQSTRTANVDYVSAGGDVYFVLENFPASGTYTPTLGTGMSHKIDPVSNKCTLTFKSNTAAGAYSYLITPNANYKWKGLSNDQTAKAYTIIVNPQIVSELKLIDPKTNMQIDVPNLTVSYTGAPINIVFAPTVTNLNTYWKTYNDTYVNFRIYYASNNTPGISHYPTALTLSDTDKTQVSGSYIQLTDKGTYNIDVQCADGNYKWSDNSAGTVWKRFTITVAAKQIPILEMEYNGAVVRNNNISVDYSINTVTFYLKRPSSSKGAVSDSEYQITYSGNSVSKVSITQVQDEDGADTGESYYTIVMRANTPGTYYVYLDVKSGNFIFEGTGAAAQQTYQIDVAKKTLAFPQFFLIESAPTDEDPDATKDTPLLDGETRDYSGVYHRIKITNVQGAETGKATEIAMTNVSGYSAFVTAASSGAYWTGTTRVITARDAGSYAITINIANTNLFQWADGSTSKTFTFTVNRARVAYPEYYSADTAIGVDKTKIVTNSYSTIYNGGDQYVRLYMDNLSKISVTGNNSIQKGENKAENYVYFYITAANTYTLTAALNANYVWPNGDTNPYTYTFIIAKAQIAAPQWDDEWFADNLRAGTYTFDNNDVSVEYTGGLNIDARIKGYNTSYMNRSWYYWNNSNHSSYTPVISGNTISFNNVRGITPVSGSTQYPAYITIGLSDSNYEWSTGGTTPIRFTLYVIYAKASVPNMNLVEVETDEDGVETEIFTPFVNDAFDAKYVPGQAYNFRLSDMLQSHFTITVAWKSLTTNNADSSLKTDIVFPNDSKIPDYIELADANLRIANAGVYVVSVALKSGVYWGNTTDRTTKTFTITIQRTMIDVPKLQGGVVVDGQTDSKTVIYNGSTYSLVLLSSQTEFLSRTDTDTNKDWNSSTVAGNTMTFDCTTANVGTYVLNIGFTTVNNRKHNYTFSDGTDRHVYKLIINPKPVAVPTIVTADGMNDGATFDGNKKVVTYDPNGRTLVILGYDSNDMKVVWSCSEAGYTTPNTDDVDAQGNPLLKLRARAVTTANLEQGASIGRYVATFSVGSNWSWETTDGKVDRDNKFIYLQIMRKDVALPTPTIIEGTDFVSGKWTSDVQYDAVFTYNTAAQGFTFTYLKDVELDVSVEGGVSAVTLDAAKNLYQYTVQKVKDTAMSVGKYCVQFRIHKYNSTDTNYKWADQNSAEWRYYYIQINPKEIDTPKLVTGTNDPFYDAESNWSGSTKNATYNMESRYLVVSGFTSLMTDTSKTASPSGRPVLSKYTPPTPPASSGEDDEENSGTVWNENYTAYYATDAGTYVINFNLFDSVNYKWKDTGNTNPVPITLIIDKRKIAVPKLDTQTDTWVESGSPYRRCYRKTVAYTGQDISMILSPWDDDEVIISSAWSNPPKRASFANPKPGVFTAKTVQPGSSAYYYVCVRVKNSTNYDWDDGDTAERVYYLNITPQAVAMPQLVKEDDNLKTANYDTNQVGTNYGVKTVTYTGENLYIKINVPYGKVRITSLGGLQRDVANYDDDVWKSTNELRFYGSSVGTYTLQFGVADANYKWSTDAPYDSKVTVQLVIRKLKVTRPSIVKENLGDGGVIVDNTKTVEYRPTAEAHMNISVASKWTTATYYSNPSRDEIAWLSTDILDVWANNVNTYTFRFTLKSTANLEWDDGNTGQLDLILKIVPKLMEIPLIKGYGTNKNLSLPFSEVDGNPQTQYMDLINSDPDGIDFDVIKAVGQSNDSANGSITVENKADDDTGYKHYLCSASYVATYTVTLSLVNGTNYNWNDSNNTNGDVKYTFQITRKSIDLPQLYSVTTVTKKVTDGEGNVTEVKDEVLQAVMGARATFEYDGTVHYFRMTGVLDGIVSFRTNNNAAQSSTSSYTAINGNLVGSADYPNEKIDFSVSQVFFRTTDYLTVDYVITLSLNPAKIKNYVWNDGSSGTGDKLYYIKVTRKQIDLPTIKNNTGKDIYSINIQYDGAAHDMTLLGYDNKLMTFESSNINTKFESVSEQNNGKELFCQAVKDVRNNYVTLKLQDTMNTGWRSTANREIGDKTYYLYVVQARYIIPSVVGANTVRYNGTDYTIQYRDVKGPEYMEYILSDTTGNMSSTYDAATGILTVTLKRKANIGSYYVTFTLPDGLGSKSYYNNARWDSSYNNQNKSVYFYTQKAQVDIPQIVGNGTSLKKSVQYSGSAQKLELTNYLTAVDSDNLPIWMSYTLTSTAKFIGNKGTWNSTEGTMDFSAENVASYTVRVSTNTLCTFTDNSTYKDYTLEITKKVYDSPFFVDDGNGTTTATQKTFNYRFERQGGTLTNVIGDKNLQTGAAIYWRDVTGYAAGASDSDRLVITWDKNNQTATATALNPGTYTIRFEINSTEWQNARWSTTTAQYIDYKIVINRTQLPIPQVVKTDLKLGENVSGRTKYSVYNGGTLILQIKDFDEYYMEYKDVTSYNGKGADYEAKFEYDAVNKILNVKVKYVNYYLIRISKKNGPHTYWQGYSSDYYYRNLTWDYAMSVSKSVHPYPTLASGTAASVVYTGKDIEFAFDNVVQGTDQYVITTSNSMKEVDWDNGKLTLSAKDVGTYTVKISIIDTDNSSWNKYTSYTYNLSITRKALSADLSFSSSNAEINQSIVDGNLSWPSGVPVFLNVGISGLNPVDGETVGIKAWYYNNATPSVTTVLNESGANTRRYPIPTTLQKGTYYAVIQHADAADNYTLNQYKIKFVISADPARFTDTDLVWQYNIAGGTNTVINGSHSTQASAFDVTYAGADINFSITLNDAALKTYNVRLVGYSGDTVASNVRSDVYHAVVTITAYDSSYYFPRTDYHLYYRISKAKFDLSQVKWDYKDPFIYKEDDKKNVTILGNSLPAGLTVAGYTGDLDKIDASEGKARGYITGVTFKAANENYIEPIQSDPNTYTGTFAWTCEWNINKASIDVDWKQTIQVDENSKIFNIPILATNSEMVTYTYEQWSSDDFNDPKGQWIKVSSVKNSDHPVKYRVTPKLKDGSQAGSINYAANYKLVPYADPTIEHEFTVGENSVPIVVSVYVNGKDANQFPYTGSQYVAGIVLEQDAGGRVKLFEDATHETEITYKDLGSNTTGHIAPIRVGRYQVTITFWYKIDGGTPWDGTIIEEFEIVKGTFDTSMLVWKINSLNYTYDADQGKWLDASGKEVKEFAYTGNQYELLLTGTPPAGLTVRAGSFSGNTATDAGDYTASFKFDYDKDCWEVPAIPESLDWSIVKKEINMSSASWSYTEAFTYEIENGAAKTHKVELVIPKDLQDLLNEAGATLTYSGPTSASNAGSYTVKAVFNMSAASNKNYAIVFPVTLSDTLNWTVSPRTLTTPEFNGKWSTFDGKTHELVEEVCDADSDWTDFYTVKFEYSIDGTRFMNYTGYGNPLVQTDAFTAQTYRLTFTIKDSVNTKTQINAVWEDSSSVVKTVKFTVDKLVATVIGWNGNYEETTAITDWDDVVQSMLTYSFEYTENDTVKYATKDQVKQLGGGIVVTVKPAVLSAYASNVSLEFLDEDSKTYQYTTKYEGIEWLDYPTLIDDEKEYTGSAITFAVNDWANLSKYLEIEESIQTSSNYLIQTNVGVYTATLRIKASANASWKTLDGSLDRDSKVELDFTIKIKTLAVPTVPDSEFTGNKINAVNLLPSDLLNFVNVTGTNEATNEGKYTFKLSFKTNKNCAWEDGTDEDKEITWQINQKVIETPDAGGWTVFDGEVHNLVEACGYEDGWEDYFTVSIEYSVDGTDGTFAPYTGHAGEQYDAYKTGVYRMTFSIKSGLNDGGKSNVVWSNSEKTDQVVSVSVSKYVVTVDGWFANQENSTVKLVDGTTAPTKFFDYKIYQIKYNDDGSEREELSSVAAVLTAGVGAVFVIRLEVKLAYVQPDGIDGTPGFEYAAIEYTDTKYEAYRFATSKIQLDKPTLSSNTTSGSTTVEYNGTAYTFEISEWTTKYNKYLELDKALSELVQTEAGKYEITLSFKTGSIAEWKDGTSDPLTLTFEITEKGIEKPVVSSTGYTGSVIDILAQYLATYGSYVEVKADTDGTYGAAYGNKQTSAGSYTFIVGLKNTASTKWADGTKTDLTLTWSITQNRLTKPADTGNWTTFDAANHDLYALCGLPTDWSSYYTATITYAADGTTYAPFTGSTGYAAGSYKLTFAILSTLNPGTASNVVWEDGSADGSKDPVEVIINVDKLTVNVIGWNESKNTSTVQLENGTLPASLEKYIFTKDGLPIDEADIISSTDEGVIYFKKLNISDDNVNITYAETSLEKYKFVMIVHEMEIPQLTTDSVQYSGRKNTFYITDWDLYRPYVEITSSSDSLDQTDAGSFSVTLRIKDTAVATWDDGTTADVTLSFEVTQVVVIGTWDKMNVPHTFTVTGTNYPITNPNQLVTLTYTDKNGATVAVTDFAQGETYTATIAIASSYAVNYVLDGDLDLTSTFQTSIVHHDLQQPTFKDDKLPYNGAAQTFEIKLWENIYEDWVDIIGDLTQTNTGEYSVTLHLKDGLYARWADLTTADITLKFYITAVVVSAEWDITGTVPVLNTSATVYTGGALPSDLITYTFKDDQGNAFDPSTETFAEGVKYYASAAIHMNYTRNFAFASDVQTALVFTVVDGEIVLEEITKIEKPSLVKDTQEYTGANVVFAIENWSTNYVQYLEIVDGSLTQVEAGSYSVTLAFKANATAIWTTGGMENVVLNFTIAPKTLSGSWVFDDTDVVQPYVDLVNDGFGTLPANLLTYVVTDADGNTVSSSGIKVGTTYKITVSVSDDNYAFDSSFEKEKVFTLNSDGTIGEIVVVRLDLPAFVNNKLVFNGMSQTFVIADFDSVYAPYVTLSGDSLTQTDISSKPYKVTFTINDPMRATWANGSTDDYTLSFEIVARTTALEVEKPAFADEVLTYTGMPITFEIIDWLATYKPIVDKISESVFTQTEVGKYSVTLHITNPSQFIWTDGTYDDITLTFEIVPNQIDGTWECGDELPYFEPDTTVFGEYPDGLFTYVITDKDGKVITLAETETEVTYYMTMTLTSGNFEFAAGVNTTCAFRYSKTGAVYIVEMQLLAYPQFVEETIEYDGEAHTFVIDNWDYLSQYLTMTGDSLTQTEIGEYEVTFKIKDTTLASWENGTYRTITVIFKIGERTTDTVILVTPTLDKTSVKYDGNAHTFVIVDWDKNYEGLVEISGDDLTQIAAGKYSVTLRIKNKFLYRWADGKDTYTLNFEVETIKVSGSWSWGQGGLPIFVFSTGGASSIETPSADAALVAVDENEEEITSAVEEGEEDTVVAEDLEYHYEIRLYDGSVIFKGSQEEYIEAIALLTSGINYYVKIVMKDSNLQAEPDTIVIRLNDENVLGPVETGVQLEDITFVNEAIKYDGITHTFEIANWDYLGIYLEIVAEKSDSFFQKEIGIYTVTLRIIDPSLASWKTPGKPDEREFTFRVIDGDQFIVADRPTFENEVLEYTGSPIPFKIVNFDKIRDLVKIWVDGDEGEWSWLTQTDVDTYQVTIKITDGSLSWSDGTRDDVVLTFRIKKCELVGAWEPAEEDPQIPAFSPSNIGRLNDIPEDVLTTVITDRNGNVVDTGSLADGETYLITNSVSDEYVGSYSLPSEYRTAYFKYNANGTWEMVNGFPEEEKPDFVVWIAIGVSIILVAFLVVLIVFMIRVISERKRQNRAHEDLEAQKIEAEAEKNKKKEKKSKKSKADEEAA